MRRFTVVCSCSYRRMHMRWHQNIVRTKKWPTRRRRVGYTKRNVLKKVGVLPIRVIKSNVSSRPLVSLWRRAYARNVRQFTIRIGSTPTACICIIYISIFSLVKPLIISYALCTKLVTKNVSPQNASACCLQFLAMAKMVDCQNISRFI